MSYTQEQIRVAYKKLSEKVQDFVMSNDTTELISENLKGIGLSEGQVNIADSEIFYALLQLQTLDTTINKIAELSNKKIEELSPLKTALKESIFNNYPETEVVVNNTPNLDEKKTPEEPIIITKDTKEDAMKELNRRSEEIQKMQAPLVQRTKPTTNDQRPTTETKILEIAPEIHPVIEPREVVHEVPHVESKQTSNLQTSKPQTVSVPDYRYPKGKDPYREPIDN